MNRSIRYHFISFGTCRTMTCLEINKNRSVKYNRTVIEAYTTVLSKTNSTTIRGDRIEDLSIKRLCCYPVLFGSVAPHGHIVRSIFFISLYQSFVFTSLFSWKQPSEYAAFCIVSAARDKCQTYCMGKGCNDKHNRLRGETVVVLSTGYPPHCVAYSRHAKVPAVVRTSCLQMIRAVHAQTFNEVPELR